MSEKKRWELYAEDRASGMTYREIAAKYGVTYQAVAQVCSKRDASHFRSIKEDECVYPNLRSWMNENKVARNELSRRMFGNSSSVCLGRISAWLHGKCYPTKLNIDRLIAVTGLTYEQLFERGADNA